MKLKSGGSIFGGSGSRVRMLTFSRKGVHGRFGGLLGAQSRGKEHAPGRLGLHFGRHFRSKIDVNFDMIFDMVFDCFLIDFWRFFGSKIDHFWITFPKQRFYEK